MTAAWEQFVDFLRGVLTTLADAFAFLGGHRWAAGIIALTVIIRTLLLPLAVKQIKSMRETQRLQPEIARLRQKYRSDRQKQMQEMQALYQREGVNPYASCLPMVAQAPVLFAMFYVIRDLEETAGAMPFLGLGDLSEPSSRSIAGWLLIVLMTGTQLLSTRHLNPGQTDQQRRMQMLMPVVFIFFFINLPAALLLYYTTQTLYQFVQQLVMTRDMRKPGSGWRGLLGLTPPGKAGAKQARREEKPQVKTPSPAPAERQVAPSFDALAARRTLDEKRDARRRRRKKKKQRKR
jgi:YidC/Oxa1 family membrane protein insertase